MTLVEQKKNCNGNRGSKQGSLLLGSGVYVGGFRGFWKVFLGS